jgi:metaxin
MAGRSRKVTLHLQPAAWGLPTARPDFLHVLTYCKLADVNYAVASEASFGGSSMADGKDEMPVMTTEQSAVTGANNIIKSLQGEGKDLDATLSPQERAETYAFIAVLQGTLQTAMDCEWYLNETNWFEVVKVRLVCDLCVKICAYLVAALRAP